jgi:hypothetical protein
MPAKRPKTKTKVIKIPCCHGALGSCVARWPGTMLGACTACGAQMQLVAHKDADGVVRTRWAACDNGGARLPVCGDADLETGAPHAAPLP